MSAPDRLRSDRLREALSPVRIGREILVIEEAGSTNDVVAEMATTDSPEGLVVFAEHQTAGRGQRGKTWASCPYKGLWFSILLRPILAIEESARLTSWAAQTVASTIEDSSSLRASVKLPNDVYVSGRKIAGVLVEMRAQPRAAHLVILGIGLNVNHTPDDFPEDFRERATSLAIETGSRHDRHSLAVALLRNLDRTYSEVTR